MEIRPLRARERPFVLVAQDEFFSGVPDLQLHAWLLVPTVPFTLQKIVEEALLQCDTIIGVERRPVRAAVHFQPFLFRGRAREALEVAARVQALTAPVRRREERHGDPGKIGTALGVVRPPELARQERLPHVLAVLLQFRGRKRFRAAYRLASDAALRTALALPVLHRLHLHVLPVLAEAADDSAVARALTVGVVPAFPHADRREVRRLRGGGAPLVARVVRNPVHAHIAVAPALSRSPLDTQVEVAGLARVVVAQISRRPARAA